MIARNARGRFAPTPHGDHWERQRAAEDALRLRARRTALVRRSVPHVTTARQAGRVAALCEEWGLPVPRFPRLPVVTLPEVAPGVFANTDDPAFVAALEAL